MHSYTLSNWDGSSTQKKEDTSSSPAQMQNIGSLPEPGSVSTTGQAIAHGIQLDARGLGVNDREGVPVEMLDLGVDQIIDAVCITSVLSLSGP